MLNENDLELLSAYLDGALNAEQRAALEVRLQSDAELARELARLRATVDLVKTLPTLTAPRDFTLTAQMLRQRRPTLFTSAAFSALSTAAAIILLVIGVTLFNQHPGASNTLREQVAFAPTAGLQSTQVVPGSLGGAILPPLVADGAQQSTTEQAQAPSDLLAQPTTTPLSTTALMFAASVPAESPSAQESAADSTASESAADQQRNLQQVAPALNSAVAPSAASGAAAPAPAPTLFPTMTPSDTPTSTPSPTHTPRPTSTPSPTASTMPTATPIPPLSVPEETNASLLGVGLIVLALILFGLAVVTTFLRRRA